MWNSWSISGIAFNSVIVVLVVFVLVQKIHENSFHQLPPDNNTSTLYSISDRSEHSTTSSVQPVALCLSVRQQHADIVEWVLWHKYIGVDKIYIFDENSTPPMHDILQPYIDIGLVEYYNYLAKGAKTSAPGQMYVYNTCLQLFQGRHNWIGLIDTDEYIYPYDIYDNIIDINIALAPYLQYGGVGLNWKICGSNGHITRPYNGTFSIIKSYTACAPDYVMDNGHVKIIANTLYTYEAGPSPHETKTHPGYPNVDTIGRILTNHRSDPYNVTSIVLYHYATQSYADYLNKVQRGNGFHDPKPISWYDYVQQASTERNDRLARQAVIAEQKIQPL